MGLGWVDEEPKYAEMPRSLISALLLLNVLWQFVAFDMWERAYSIPEGRKTANIVSASISGLLFFLMLIFFLVMGLAEKQMDLSGTAAVANPFTYFLDNLPRFLPGFEGACSYLVPAFLYFAICVHLSTVDTYLSSAGLAAYKDLCNCDQNMDSNRGLKGPRWAIAGVALVSAVIGLVIAIGFWPDKLADILVDVLSLQLLLLPVLIYKKFFSRSGGKDVHTGRHTVWSLVVGMLFYGAFFISWRSNENLNYWIPAIGMLGATLGLLGWEFMRVWVYDGN